VTEKKKKVTTESVVGQLARRGEVRARDLQNLAKTVVDRIERNRAELARLVQKEIRRQVNAVGLATRDEVEALRKRIHQLEQKKAPTKARAKSSTTKR
jgi:BMFP domain-containing protein YqiC